MKKVNLNAILEEALEEALASLKAKAAGMVEATLGAALEAKVRELLGEDLPTPTPTPAPAPAPTPTPTLRARGKAQAIPLEAAPAKEESAPAKAPRRRKKEATQAKPEEDLTAILEGAKLALGKYSGVSTPRGKPLPEVLYRRVKKTLEHAQGLGRNDVPALARSALAHIASDPKGVAMQSWQALAAKLGLPVPIVQE